MIIFIFTTISRKRGAYAIALRLRLYCIKLKSSFLLTAAYIYGKKHMKTKAWLTLLTLFFHTLLSFGCAVTPEPISEYDHWTKAIADKDRLYENQPPLTEPITLSMAIARALTYNYDHRLAMMEGVFQSEEMVVANLGMLPKLTASAGYTTRNNDSASRSISYFTRQQTLEPSISQERQRTIADLSFNWSILDFGISYFQAKQYADRYLIMEERRRRVSNNIVKDVVTTQDEVTATGVAYFLGTKKVLVDVRPTNTNGQEALDKIFEGTPFIGHSDITNRFTSYYIRKQLIDAIPKMEKRN